MLTPKGGAKLLLLQITMRGFAALGGKEPLFKGFYAISMSYFSHK